MNLLFIAAVQHTEKVEISDEALSLLATMVLSFTVVIFGLFVAWWCTRESQ